MKRPELTKLLTWMISLELIISPLGASAQSSNTAQNILGVATQMFNTAVMGNNGQPGQQFNANQAKFAQMEQAIPDKYFNAQKLMAIPGLGNYLALNNINPSLLNCSTLPSTSTDFQIEACETGDIRSPYQDQEVVGYAQLFSKVSKTYENYLSNSNTGGQLFGVGCMKNAMQILKGFFDYKLNELDKMSSKMEAITNNFKEASRADLDAIEESTAVLEGGNSDLTNKVRTKNPDLFDFGKRFNNPACNSMFSKNEDLTEKGVKGGLNAINKDIYDMYNDAGNGKYSAKSYQANHNMIVQDLETMADSVAKQVQLNFSNFADDQKGAKYSSFLKDLPSSISTTQGTEKALKVNLFADLQSKFLSANDKLLAEEKSVLTELNSAGVSSSQISNIRDLMRSRNDSTYQTEIRSVENQIKNGCITNKVGNVNEVISKMIDPNSSSFANKHASSFIKTKLEKIMTNRNSSPSQKLAELQSLESSGSQSSYLLQRQGSYEKKSLDAKGNIVSTEVKANTQVSAAQYFIDQIQSCETDFKATNLGNKFSGSDVSSKLLSLNQSYKNLRDTHANEIKQMLKTKLITCQTSEQANSTTPGSCNSNKFDPGATGFCAAGALSCSKNMKQCSDLATNFVKQIKTDRTARVNNYKGLVEKNKKDIVNLFDNIMSTYSKEAEAMRGMFGVGFTAPTGIQREVPEGERFLSSFKSATKDSVDGAMLLDDPEKYLSMFKENIGNLKKSVQEQQDQILGGTAENPRGLLAKHVQDPTEKNLKAVQSKYKQMYDKCIAAHNNYNVGQKKMADEQNKKNQEMGEKLNKYCNLYSDAMSDHPNGACKQNVNDLANDALKAVQTLNPGASGDFERTRVEINATCGEYQNSHPESNGSESINAYDICVDPGLITKLSEINKEIVEYCKKLNDTSDKGCNSEAGNADTKFNQCKKIETLVARLKLKYERDKGEALVGSKIYQGKGSDSVPQFCVGNSNTQFNEKSMFDSFGQNILNNQQNPLGQRQ